MRTTLLIVILVGAVVGCAHHAASPLAPDVGQDGVRPVQEARAIYDERYRLWGEWALFFNAERTQVDVVPRRQGRFHLNATKILETSCGDCLEITHIHNNGDGTINLMERFRAVWASVTPHHTNGRTKDGAGYRIARQSRRRASTGWAPRQRVLTSTLMAITGA